MYTNKLIFLLAVSCCITLNVFSQKNNITDSLKNDSLFHAREKLLIQQKQQQQIDSLVKSQLQNELQQAAGNNKKTKDLEAKLSQIAIADSIHKARQLQTIEELKKTQNGFPVTFFDDTLFYIYTEIGSFTAQARATAISQRIKTLYDDPFYHPDSLNINETENNFDILYNNETVVLSVTGLDALWSGKDGKQIATVYLREIKEKIAAEREANSLVNWIKRFALVALIIIVLALLVIFINRLFNKIKSLLIANREKYLKGISIRKIKILTPQKHLEVTLKASNILKIIVIILAVYLSLPMLFSVFPETKMWRDTLLGWVLTPAKSAFNGIINFLPDLFAILVIYFFFRYAIKGAKYFVNEIEKGNIQIRGFHADWAKPTFNIIKFLLYAFMLVLIFPYLPGSGSTAFRGVSVFVGILFSLGSSSAISNMIAGIVITYMRPFKIGDRIKIGEITGDVTEKTMLITRIRTIKNEDITVPNSTILSSSTVNYSSNTKPEDKGLILHTTVTIGYDVPWKQMHQALINAAIRTDMILKEPKPFVLQTSLDDFYVSYQINAYTKEANKQAAIYSQLHQNIQDCCNESGIEILSPHYSQLRDGNVTTIPTDYLDKNYKAPTFNIKQEKDEEK